MIKSFLLIILLLLPVQASAIELFFAAKVKDLWMQNSSLAEGKTPSDVVDVILQGVVYEPPLFIADMKKSRLSRYTVLDAFASDISAMKVGDTEWLIENWAMNEQDWPSEMLENEKTIEKSQKWALEHSPFQVNAVAQYKDKYKLVFLANRPLIFVFKKVDGGEWKKTNDLVSDETFDVVFSSYRTSGLESGNQE